MLKEKSYDEDKPNLDHADLVGSYDWQNFPSKLWETIWCVFPLQRLFWLE